MLSEFLPWSEWRRLGTPNLQSHSLTISLATVDARWSWVGTAWVYFEKISVMTRMFSSPFLFQDSEVNGQDLIWMRSKQVTHICTGSRLSVFGYLTTLTFLTPLLDVMVHSRPIAPLTSNSTILLSAWHPGAHVNYATVVTRFLSDVGNTNWTTSSPLGRRTWR